MQKAQSYRLGIKRRWWWGYRVYHVTDHHHFSYLVRDKLKNVLNIRPKLHIYLVDGSQLSVPDVESLEWKLYPEYKAIEEKLARKKRLVEKAVPTASAPNSREHSSEEISPSDLPRSLQ